MRNTPKVYKSNGGRLFVLACDEGRRRMAGKAPTVYACIVTACACKLGSNSIRGARQAPTVEARAFNGQELPV